MRENSTSRVIRNFGRVRDAVEIPDLVAIQRKSYDNFLQNDVAPTKRKDAGLEALKGNISHRELRQKDGFGISLV